MRGESRKWLPEEDSHLLELVTKRGTQDWDLVASHFDMRTAKQCRQRWIGCLSPGIRKDTWTQEEDEMLVELIQEFGPKWEKIQVAFVRRTGSDIKNRYFNLTRCGHQLKQKLQSHNKFDFETPTFGDDEDDGIEAQFVPNDFSNDSKTGPVDETRPVSSSPTADIVMTTMPIQVSIKDEKAAKPTVMTGAAKMTSLFSLSRTSPPKTPMIVPPTATAPVTAPTRSIGLFSLTPKSLPPVSTSSFSTTAMPFTSKCGLLEDDTIDSVSVQFHDEAGLVPESIPCKQQCIQNQKGIMRETDGHDFQVVELGHAQRKPHELPCIPHLLGRRSIALL